MLSLSQKNTCLLIALGKMRIKDLKRKLTSEEKQEIKDLKEIIRSRRKLGLNDFVNAMCVNYD